MKLLRTLSLLACGLIFVSAVEAQLKEPPKEPEKPKYKAIGKIERLDPALDELLDKEAKIEVLADGFEWTEGPAWNKEDGYLLFSDIPQNRIFRWKEAPG